MTAAVKDKQDISEKALIAALHKVAKASGDDSKDRTITFKLAAAKTQEVVEIEEEEDKKPAAKKAPPKNDSAGAQFGRGGGKNDGSKDGSKK